jgi:hypothetical protein
MGLQGWKKKCDEQESELKSLRSELAARDAEVERLRKPTHYWYEDLEYAIDGPEQVVSEQHIDRAGAVFEVTPLRAMDKVFYATVPDKQDDNAEWSDGDYCGDLQVIGPFATQEEAKHEADRLIAEAAKEAK